MASTYAYGDVSYDGSHLVVLGNSWSLDETNFCDNVVALERIDYILDGYNFLCIW